MDQLKGRSYVKLIRDLYARFQVLIHEVAKFGVVALVHYGFGLTGNLAFNVANIFGIGLATLFRLYCYRRWVFLYADGEAPAAEQLEPETSGT